MLQVIPEWCRDVSSLGACEGLARVWAYQATSALSLDNTKRLFIPLEKRRTRVGFKVNTLDWVGVEFLSFFGSRACWSRKHKTPANVYIEFVLNCPANYICSLFQGGFGPACVTLILTTTSTMVENCWFCTRCALMEKKKNCPQFMVTDLWKQEKKNRGRCPYVERHHSIISSGVENIEASDNSECLSK